MAAAKAPTPREPYVGAIVLYVDLHMGDIYPAIITRVRPPGGPPDVFLTAFGVNASPFPVRGLIPFDPTGTTRGSWHWGRECSPGH